MARVSITRSLVVLVLFASAICTAAAVRAEPTAPQLAPLAHSALLTVDAAPAAGGVVLRVRRTAGETPLVMSDLALTIDGKSEPATARPDGSWFVARPAGMQDAGKTIDVTIGHDGIHEVFTGRLAPSAARSGPAGASGAGAVVSSTHKQFFWWILNIGIVLVAVIAISRRTS